MYLFLLILFTNKIIFNYPYILGTTNKTDSTTLQKNTNNFDLLGLWHTNSTKLKSNVIENKELKNLKYNNNKQK